MVDLLEEEALLVEQALYLRLRAGLLGHVAREHDQVADRSPLDLDRIDGTVEHQIALLVGEAGWTAGFNHFTDQVPALGRDVGWQEFKGVHAGQGALFHATMLRECLVSVLDLTVGGHDKRHLGERVQQSRHLRVLEVKHPFARVRPHPFPELPELEPVLEHGQYRNGDGQDGRVREIGELLGIQFAEKDDRGEKNGECCEKDDGEIPARPRGENVDAEDDNHYPGRHTVQVRGLEPPFKDQGRGYAADHREEHEEREGI